MNHEDRFTNNKKRVNPNSWQETDAHLDHAAGEYEPLSSAEDGNLNEQGNLLDDGSGPSPDEVSENELHLKIVPERNDTT